MAAYIDNARILWKGKLRFHMTADSLAELHEFAAKIGVNRCWLHPGSRFPHYDVTEPQREAALAAGARSVDSKELVLTSSSP